MIYARGARSWAESSDNEHPVITVVNRNLKENCISGPETVGWASAHQGVDTSDAFAMNARAENQTNSASRAGSSESYLSPQAMATPTRFSNPLARPLDVRAGRSSTRPRDNHLLTQ